MTVRLVAGLRPDEVDTFIDGVLREDLGGGGDVTSISTIGPAARLSGVIAARQALVLAGVELAELFFRKLDAGVVVERVAQDGETVHAGGHVLRVSGAARSLLAAERSALNTLAHLSGIATLAAEYARAIAGTGCTLLDTRKTVPGLRALAKYAAKAGGASNHRMRLDDGVLIKDNHIAVAGSVSAAVSSARAAGLSLGIQVEVDRLDQIEEALEAGADSLLCDNMTTEQLRSAGSLVAGRVPIEASGGINLATVRDIASTGVTYVSVGRITQSAPAVDIGLDYLPQT